MCSNGTADGACQTGASLPNITTRVSFYTCETTILASRTNYTIVSVEDTSTPVLYEDVDLIAYRDALRWLLNYTAANIPAPSSIAESFWSSTKQLQNPSSYGILKQNFQSIVAFPFWFFNSNNDANFNLVSNTHEILMPNQFYTTASIVEPYVMIKFNEAMFILFITLQAFAIIFIWALLFWVWLQQTSRLPEITSFPVFDVTYKTTVEGEGPPTEDVLGTESSTVLKLMKHTTVTVNEE